jgi:predicted nuclease of predicted toxin-antitoxin system
VRFLVDTCAGRRLAEWLRAEGYDVARVTDVGPDPGDAAVLERALAERRVLITMDKDFGALVHRDRLEHAGVIRLPHATAAGRIAIVRQLLAKHPEAELVGAIVAIRGTRVRILRRRG